MVVGKASGFDGCHPAGGELGAGTGFGGIDACGQRHAHAAASERFRLAEESQITVGHAQGIGHPRKGDASIGELTVDDGGGTGSAQGRVHRQAEDGAGM